jgi:MFS family permease
MIPAYPSPGRAAFGIVFLALLGFVLTTDITLTALLAEPMKRDLELTDVQLALLQGTAYGLALGLASLPAGRLIDRVSRRLLLGVGLVAWTGALIVIGLANSFALVIVGRMGLGLVAALVVPAAFSFAADLYPPERRSVSTSLLVVGQALGQGCGVLFGGLAFDALTGMARSGELAGMAPWRVLYLAAALIGGVLLLLHAFTREPARHERREQTSGLRLALTELWTFRRFFFPLLFGLLFAQVTIQAAAIWSSPLLIRRGLTPGGFAGWLGAILLFGGIAGALAGGDRTTSRRSARRPAASRAVGAGDRAGIAVPAHVRPAGVRRVAVAPHLRRSHRRDDRRDRDHDGDPERDTRPRSGREHLRLRRVRSRRSARRGSVAEPRPGRRGDAPGGVRRCVHSECAGRELLFSGCSTSSR